MSSPSTLLGTALAARAISALPHRRLGLLSIASLLLALVLLLCTLLPPALSQELPSHPSPPVSPPPSLVAADSSNQQPLRPHSPGSGNSSVQPSQRVGAMGVPQVEGSMHGDENEDDLSREEAAALAAAGTVDESVVGSGAEVADESGFWLFEFVVLSALVPAVWYWRKRKQYVMAMHHRRLDRMVNS